MEICDCPQCIKFDFTNELGKKTQGVLVSQRTRNCHWESHCQSDYGLSEIILKTEILEAHDAKQSPNQLACTQESKNVDYFTKDNFVNSALFR